MKIEFDPEIDAAYLQIDESEIIDSSEVEPGIIFDYNRLGNVVGVEILGVNHQDIHQLLSLKIPFFSMNEKAAFENFLREHAKV